MTPLVELSELMVSRGGSVDPSRFPDELFDLYSIPSFDLGSSTIVAGADIGSVKQVVRPGDVLLSKIVPHIRRAWVVEGRRGHRIVASGEWIVFRNPDVDSNYLRHLLISDWFHANFMATVSGVGGSLLRARPAFVSKIRVPLPAIDEQRRIADILDRADALRAHRQRALALLGGLSTSIFYEMFGEPLQEGASRRYDVPLSNVARFVRGVTFKPGDVTAGGEGSSVAVLRTKNVQRELETSDLVFLPRSLVRNQEKFVVAGDTLISSANSWNLVGKCCLVPDLAFPAAIGGFVTVLRRLSNEISSRYLFEWFASPPVQRRARAFSNQTTNIANLSLAQCLNLPIFVPPVSKQAEFRDRALKSDSLTDAARQSLLESRALMSAVQHAAFAGEL